MCYWCRHTYGEFHLNEHTDTLESCSATGDETLRVHPSYISSSLPHRRRDHQQHGQQQKSAGDVHVEVSVTESENLTRLAPTLDAQKVLEDASTTPATDLRQSSRSDVERLRRRISVDAPGSDRMQIVVEVHPPIVNGDVKLLGDLNSAVGVRSSAPELHLLTPTTFEANVTQTSEQRRKRQFVVVAVEDDVKRLATHPRVHMASGVRRSGSCTLPTEMQSPTTARRYVISLTNLDTGKFSVDAVPSRHPSPSPASSQQVSLALASVRSSDQVASVTVAPSSSRCAATSDRDWREVSKELWSLRALLANHEDISFEESVDEVAAAAATMATTPQSADDVSVKSSADTVVSVDDPPLPTASTAADKAPALTTVTTAVADPQLPSVDAASADDGITRKPSIRRQNYREAIARRQNHRLQTAAVVSGSHELSIPTSSVEASSEPTDTESSLSFEKLTYASSAASSNETTASSFGDSMTSTDSTAGGSGSDGHGGGHRLEQLRGDSGYRSLEAQQSLGQARDIRRQSASHFLLDSSANVIYEDQMTTAASSDDVRTAGSLSSVVSVQQMQCSTAVGVSIPVSLPAADSAGSGSTNMRGGHRHNKAAQRKRIQYRCERQAVEIHDSVAVGDPIEYKVIHHSHHHHHQHHHQPHHHHQQPHRFSTDAGSVAENLAERGSIGTTATTTTTTTTTTKPSLFCRFLRTTHVASGSSAGAGGVASRRNSLIRMQRDYSIDERSNAIFNEFLRHDPAYDTKHTLSVHARSSRSARRNRIPRSPMSSRAGRRRLAIEEQASSTLSAAETLPADSHGQWLGDCVSHTAPTTAPASPLLTNKHLLVDAVADPRVSTLPFGRSTLREGRRRSEGSSRLGTDVTAATFHATSDDTRRRASTSVDQSPSDDRRPSDTQQTTAESTDIFPVHRGRDDAGADVGDVRRPHVSTTSEHSCQRRSAATSHRIPVIQLTTDEDTLP